MAFYNCKSLRQVSLPSTLTKIGFYTFTGCVALYDIEYNGDNATSVNGDNIFKSDGEVLESTPQNLYLPNVDDPTASNPPQDPNPWINFLGYDWTDKINYKQSMPNE